MTGRTHSNYIPVRQDWLDRRREAAIEPDLPIVDAHHHLWERPGWRYLLDELLADIKASGHNVVATVFMQCQAMYRADGDVALRPIGETEFVNGIAAAAASGTYGKTLACAGIVGHADLRLGAAVRDVLEAHIRAGGGRFKGIRYISTWDADASLLNPLSAGPPGLLADAQFREGFAQLQPLGLTFDAWLFHPQIGELTDLARAFPHTGIVLDHLGGIVGIEAYAGLRQEVFAQWSRSIRTLSSFPNVYVKLGGLGMRINGFGFEQGADPPSSEMLAATWRPYIEICIEAFGPRRCMFESNFPVDKGSYGYGEAWNAFKRLTQGASPDERAALFGDTAKRVYRLQGGTDW
jgi:predicted TIM-barrel fold metal-dependent hydrolase